MRIDGEQGWLELLRRQDEEAFDVRSAAGDFAGRNPNIWIDANEQRRFLEELRHLERERRGTAQVAAMSPNEFELVIRVVDATGHISIEGLIGTLRPFGSRYHHLLFKFSFALDPTDLPKLVRETMDLVVGVRTS